MTITSKPTSKEYRNNFDATFGKKPDAEKTEALVGEHGRREDFHSDLEDLDCLDGKIRKPAK